MAAPKTPAPDFATILPMLVDERALPLDAPGWVWELKFDGYRCLAHVEGGEVRLRSKTGRDITAWFPEVCDGLGKLRGGPHILDGEVCVLDEHGRADFDALHARALRRRWVPGAPPVVYCAFDLLAVAGEGVMAWPQAKRKARLARLLSRPLPSVLSIGQFDEGDAAAVWAGAILPLGLEGMVAKRPDSEYLPGVRSPDWVKVKRKGATPAQRFARGPNPQF